MRLKPSNICIGIDGEYWIKIFRTKTETPVNVPILPADIKNKNKNHRIFHGITSKLNSDRIDIHQIP
ncbi:MAG: hypothetical protein ABR503_13385 [Chitinophagaceae bacterium]